MHKTIKEVNPVPRCKKRRCCRQFEHEIVYKPVALPCKQLPQVAIAADEFEALRLCDHEGLDQTAAGERMGVSRGTIQRLLARARYKLIDGLIHSAVIWVGDESPKGEKNEEESK